MCHRSVRVRGCAAGASRLRGSVPGIARTDTSCTLRAEVNRQRETRSVSNLSSYCKELNSIQLTRAILQALPLPAGGSPGGPRAAGRRYPAD